MHLEPGDFCKTSTDASSRMIRSIILVTLLYAVNAATRPTFRIQRLRRTGFDAPFRRFCRPNHVLYGMYSRFSARTNDRHWTYTCRSGVHTVSHRWTGLLNGWDCPMKFVCGPNQVVTGLASRHNNRTEDRRWRARCSRLAKHLRLLSCRWTARINKLRANIRYNAAGGVIKGLRSRHNNRKEDRRWRVKRCGVCSAKLVWKPWGKWSPCNRACIQTRSRMTSSVYRSINVCPRLRKAVTITRKCKLRRCSKPVPGGLIIRPLCRRIGGTCRRFCTSLDVQVASVRGVHSPLCFGRRTVCCKRKFGHGRARPRSWFYFLMGIVS